MKFLIALILTLVPCLAQDAVTLTIRSSKDNTTRTVNLTGEAATLIAKAADHVAATSCNAGPPCLYANNLDAIRQQLAAISITVTASIPGAQLEALTTAQKTAEKALADEKRRLEALVTAVTITETQP